MNRLTVRFLGAPEVLDRDRALKFATRKALALFAYLVVEDSLHARDKLAAFFWPEAETRLAQPALRNTLARIKEALRGVDEPLRVDGDRVGLNFSIVASLDLERLTQAASHAAPAPAVLQSAVEASRGPFLDGLSLPDAPAFDEWLAVQRAAWAHRQGLVYDRLSLHQLETHQIQPAIETVMGWISLDRSNEIAYRRLMRLHHVNGDRSAALRAYKTCRALLAHDLGLTPSAETEDAAAHIRSSPIPEQAAGPDSEARQPLIIPFLGRSNEYQGLVQAFRSVKKGQAQVMVVTGESGIGKTRLSEEFLKWADTEGADVLRGRAFETSALLPFHPIIDALRERLERENAPDDLLDDAWLVELTRLLPELRERYPDLAWASGDPSTARSRLFEAIARLAEALAARRPLVWVMDDVQWADPETLDLLHYLSRRWVSNNTPILLLGLMRAEALGHGSGLREWMSGLTRTVPVSRISLPAMSAEDLQQLVTSLAGDDAPGSSELSAWLTAETAGQPFFLAETLTALDEFGALVWTGPSGGRRLDPQATLANLVSIGPQSLAPAIRDLVLSRLEWLSQSASAVLSASAVIGRNCSYRLLCAVSGLGEQDSLDALDELLSARLLIEARHDARPYTVSHDRIREVVYAQLSEARRQVFHRRALAALAETNAPSAELAHHAFLAKEWPLAFQHGLRAGDDAMRLYAVGGAARHYEAARALLNENKVEADADTCQHLYARLGQAYELGYQHRQALSVYEEMQAQAHARGSRAMELAALVARCMILTLPESTQDVSQARALALEALRLAQALEDLKAQAQIEFSLARAGKFGDAAQVANVFDHLNASARLARQAGLPAQLGVAMLGIGGLYRAGGQFERAEPALREAVDIFRGLDHRPNQQNALHNLAILHVGTGEFDAALGYLDEAARANAALGSPTAVFDLLTTRSTIHMLRGEYGRVLEELQPALEIDETQILAWMQVAVRRQLAGCYLDLGAYEAGLALCRNTIAANEHLAPMWLSSMQAQLALLEIKAGNSGAAQTALGMGAADFNLQWISYWGWWGAPTVFLAEAELALAQGELELAARRVERLAGKYDELKLRHLKPAILYLRARVALAAGHEAHAYPSLSEAVAVAGETGIHREVWAMCWTLSQLEEERGHQAAAAEWRERARAEVSHIADRAGPPELRAIFLARPEVRGITA